jgi:hypothetical protein
MKSDKYIEVHQSWVILTPPNVGNIRTSTDSALPDPKSQSKTRHQVQLQRINLRRSIHEVAEAAGIPAATIAAYERGGDPLPRENMEKIWRFLKMNTASS